jgi:hypothetical protein
MLARLIEAQSRETIELKNRIVIKIHTASFRTTRGHTIVTALWTVIGSPFTRLSAHSSQKMIRRWHAWNGADMPGASMTIRRPLPILIDKQRSPVRGTM